MELSVCLIVKNEEDVLGRCLDCASGFADEIVIIDTGSTDKTKDIAKKYTDKIYDFEWQDDFALARNFAFSKATKDYVMWLDADDTISKGEIEKINVLKKIMTADTYMLKYAISFDNDGNSTFDYYRERILKRCEQAIWQGFVHEVIAPFGTIKYVNITIEHHKTHDYNPKRNLKIYQRRIKNGEVINTRAQYYYAKELYYNRYYKKCVRELKRYLKMPNQFMPNTIDSYLTIARCYEMLKEDDKALDYLFKSFNNAIPTSEILCEIGNIFIKKEKFDNAIFFYECALNVNADYKSGGFIDKNYYYLFPHLQLCMLYFKVGDKERAKEYHLLAKAESPNNDAVKYNEQFFIS